jgi:hypothetical protein
MEKTAFYGRTLAEYQQGFIWTLAVKRKAVLDCPAGASSLWQKPVVWVLELLPAMCNTGGIFAS